jgi:hypothetical protein
MPYQLLGVQLHTMAMSGLSRVRTELFHLLVIPSLAPHPVQTDRQSTGHVDLGNLSSPPHRQVEKLAPPFRVAAPRDTTLLPARSLRSTPQSSGSAGPAIPAGRAVAG